MQPVYEFGGDGPVLNLAVANGFPPQTYTPLIQPLTERCRAICLLPRALWPGEDEPPAHFVDWRGGLAQDLINGLREHNLRGVTGVGHSFGAIATLLAAIAEPGRFRAVILLDPTILPRWLLRLIRLGRVFGRDGSGGLAARAAQRRDRFDSVSAASEYLRGRRLFAHWPEDSLRYYVESMIPAEEGGVRLAWPRAWEAYYFRTLYTGIWRELPRLLASLPLLLVRGETSSTFTAQTAARVRRICPQAAYREIRGHGHLFPQTAPEATRAVITGWLHEIDR
jgi:pimeloyl-ACP methyl ester carboxylesterase